SITPESRAGSELEALQLLCIRSIMRTGNLKLKNARRAFTLMEVVMALGVIGTMGAGCYVGFNSLNSYAVSSRLYSEAQTAAQNQIDLILSKEPFDPTKSKIPTVLTVGTTTTPNVFIYKDPVTGNNVVTGIMSTTVTDPGPT